MLKTPTGRWLGLLAASALALSGCAPTEEPAADPHGTPASETEAEVAPELTAVESAVERGSQRAATFGFDKAQSATPDELKQLRTAQVPAATSVHPEECAAALAHINSSPVQLSEDAARVDFGSDTFTGTGTVEAAELSKAEASRWLKEYRDTVQTLTGQCADVSFVVDGQKFSFSTTAVATEDPQAVGMSWQRVPQLAGSKSETEQGTVNSQVLVAERDGALYLVSFIGEEAATGKEFTQIADQILAAMKEEK